MWLMCYSDFFFFSLSLLALLQEFGHHVRLATHTNFSNFVKSADVNFYPLGGDSRDLAECKMP